MPVDPATLESGTPRTTDGRSYPDHLRPYEALDGTLLAVLAGFTSATFDDLSLAVEDGRTRAALPRCLASATWRGLVERHDPAMSKPRSFSVTALAHRRLSELK